VIDDRILVYEKASLLDFAGEILRPGGLELTDRALAFCALPAGTAVLDVGCGSAASVEHLTSHHHLNAVGLDASAVLLGAGHRRARTLPLVRARGEWLPCPKDRFGAVLAECSLSIIQDVGRALDEFWRVMRPGGYLILSDIYARNPRGVLALRRLPIESCLCGAVEEADTLARVRAHGFAVRLWEDQTDALRSFTAQLIWSQGSLQQFWCRTASCVDAIAIQNAVAQSRPGYYLLIAQKE
jgi:SAM-dependent methyltransferase